MLVVCAVIVKEGRLLLAQRSANMKHPLKWELPGGKVEENEDLKSALKREIREELGIQIAVREVMENCRFEETGFTLTPIWAEVTGGKMNLAEHAAVGWFERNSLKDLDILPTDIRIIKCIKSRIWS